VKSASNRPPQSGGGRDPRLAGAPQEPPDDTSSDDKESPGEQTVTFGAIRADDDAASIRARTRPPGTAVPRTAAGPAAPRGRTQGPATPAGGGGPAASSGRTAGPAGPGRTGGPATPAEASDPAAPPAPKEAMEAFHAAAAAAQAKIEAITASRARDAASKPASPGTQGNRPAPPSRGGPATAPGQGGPASPGVSRAGTPSAPGAAPVQRVRPSQGVPRGGAPASSGATPGTSAPHGVPASPGASRGGTPPAAPRGGTPTAPPQGTPRGQGAPGGPPGASRGGAAADAPGAAFRPGAPVPPSAPGGADAAPGALFRPSAPVPPNVPRTGAPARPSPGAPASQPSGAPASQAEPGAIFRPGAPVPPSAPGGADAAPGAFFRPGAPVPPNVPRTDGPATSPPGTGAEGPTSRETPDPVPGTGSSAPGTAEGAPSGSEGGGPGTEGAPLLPAGEAEEKQERSDKDAEPDEGVDLGATSQERHDGSEDGAESDGGTPGTGHVEDDEAGQRVLPDAEEGEPRAEEQPGALSRAGAESADGARGDDRDDLASEEDDEPAEIDDRARLGAEPDDAEPGDKAPQAAEGARRDADPAGIADAAGVADPAGITDAVGVADPADPADPADVADDGVQDRAGTDDVDAKAESEEARAESDVDAKAESEKAPDESDEDTPGGQTREIPLPEAVSEALSSALAAVRAGVTDLSFGLDLPGAEEARRVQGEILAQLDDYVIPRVHTSTAPALVVVAGSTGAGKSTLLNTLANAKISATGVRRPTTGTPVLACHPDDHEWFAESDLLGSLRRLSEPDPESASGSLVLVSTEHLPSGIALLDTPDIDSVVEEHHEIAHRMLDAADLWIFVTTAARYADAPAWRLLRLAKERGARLAIVLSRVPPRSREVITKHFVRMLTEYGLGEVERFVINENKVTDGMLPDTEVSELRQWLTELSVDDRRRAQAVRATLDGVLNSFRTRVPALAKHLEIQVAFRRDLRGDVDGAYVRAMADVDKSMEDGSLLRGEVLARWQDFAGSGDLMRTLHLRRPGRFGGGKANQQAPERLSALKSALRAGLESVVVSAAQRASEEAASRWLNRPGAQEALVAAPDLGRPSDDFARRTGRAIAAWQEHIIELIRTEGVTKRSVARVISFDDESLSLILTIGLLGYGSSDERNGAGSLPQRLVHALLGAESLRNLGVKARSDLRARIGMLFDDEMARYAQALDGAGIPDESAAARLYQATYNLEVAR